jgi:glycosyltransferase involved in cell wall biosynthesis
MNVLFLDQSGKLGGAELCLLDIANYLKSDCKVLLLSDGPFHQVLVEQGIAASVIAQDSLNVRKESNALQGLAGLGQAIPIIMDIANQAKHYDLIYANTPKALVLGALVSFISGRKLVYHLHDIISADHFSRVNRHIMVALANRAALVMANSEASKQALIQAGGKPKQMAVVYNGFNPATYEVSPAVRAALRNDLQLNDTFVIGHFSRLSPWKGQHILLEALSHCPDTVTVLLVGDALFGEDDYVAQLHQQVGTLGLDHRVKFLGFRHDIPQLMAACDLVAHTSTAPEPFGRVIVEAMLCGTPVIAAAAGGATELIDHGLSGWLCPPADPVKLGELINYCMAYPDLTYPVAATARKEAAQRFNVQTINQQLTKLLNDIQN